MVPFEPNSSTLSFSDSALKDGLESSAKMVDTQMQLDNSYLELTDCLKQTGGKNIRKTYLNMSKLANALFISTFICCFNFIFNNHFYVLSA